MKKVNYQDTVITTKMKRDTHNKLIKLKEKTGISIFFLLDIAVNEYLERKENKDGEL